MDNEEKLIMSKELRSYNFKIEISELVNFVREYKDNKNNENCLNLYKNITKENSILEILKTNINDGIKSDSIDDRIDKFGSNEQDELQMKSIKEIILNSLEDFTLRILIVSSFVSIFVNYITNGGYLFWIEGFAILMAVIISCTVQTINDYKKEKEFLKLNNIIAGNRNYKIIRNSQKLIVHKDKLVVGDIIIIDSGMEVPADSILIDGNDVKVDESSYTGESKALRKEIFSKCELLKNSNNVNNILIEGTNILTGIGKILIINVGKNSSLNVFKEKLKEKDNGLTPLELKLENITRNIGYFGLYSSILIFIILCVKLILFQIFYEYKGLFFVIQKMVSFFIVSIAILVVAIPEGLPLAVTISLAFSVNKMMEDNNLVKKMVACETMGGANIICSDKTGTLTKNEMNWVNFYSNNTYEIYNSTKGSYNDIPFNNIDSKNIFINSIALNSIEDPKSKKGNPTELALLYYLDNLNYDIEKIKNDNELRYMTPFSSERKRMSSVYKINNKFFVFMKGASEIMVDCCLNQLNLVTGNIENIDKTKTINEINNMAKKTLRTIGILYKIWDEEPNYNLKDEKNIFEHEKDNFTLIGIAGIKDVIRPEVVKAINLCNIAGIEVKMITGDNKATAQAIAEEINILKNDRNEWVMDGKEFNDLVGGLVCKDCNTNCNCEIPNYVVKNQEKFKEISKDLKVLSRSRPEDKNLLVIGLKNLDNVVAVTGDGTNDSIALKKADVGFAMNITGTDLAKQSADILILDDNFYSIVQSVKWGRSIYDSIKKFLQFQLTVNLVAVVTSLISSSFLDVPILNAVQMLWVNLIMDTLAALALSTETPTEKILERPPHRRNESIVSKKMVKHILSQAIYQSIVILIVVFKGPSFLPEYQDRGQKTVNNLITRGGEIDPNGLSPSVHFTYIFNIFVIMIIFNFINMRKLQDEKNVFEGILNAKIFIIIFILISILQYILVTHGGIILKVVKNGLDFYQWIICIIFGLLGMLVNLGVKYIDVDDYVISFGNKEVDKNDLKRLSSINVKRSINNRSYK